MYLQNVHCQHDLRKDCGLVKNVSIGHWHEKVVKGCWNTKSLVTFTVAATSFVRDKVTRWEDIQMKTNFPPFSSLLY